MTDQILKDYRVLFQYFTPTDAGPHFLFTTTLAPSAEQAAINVVSSRHRDQNVQVVQVIESNDFVSGFVYADIKAQRTPVEVAYEERRNASTQTFVASEELRKVSNA